MFFFSFFSGMKANIAPGRPALLEGQDWRITGDVLGFNLTLYFILFFSFSFCFLFIDRFIVLSFGMGLEKTKQKLTQREKERRLNEKLKST